MPRVNLDVRGMTCTSCERRITRALDKVPGVVAVTVSARRGRASLQTRGTVPPERLAAAVHAAGYEVGRDIRPWLARDRRVWRDVALAVGAVLVLALAIRMSGAASLASDAGALASSGGLAVIVLVGIAAGFSTCMALVGGIVLAVSARFAEQHRDLTARQRLRPQLAFNVGRVLGFALLGGVLGAFGSVVAVNGRLLAVMLIAVSLVMALLGLRLTQLSPRISAATAIALPSAIGGRVGEGGAKRYTDRRAALLGAGTFILPCGFTQAVQVYAMSTGSPWRAGTIMGLFALGTLPGLLGVGSLTAVLRGPAATSFFRFAGVAVLALAAINFTGGVRLIAPTPTGALSGVAGSTAQSAAEERVGSTARTADPQALPPDVSENVTSGDGVQTLRTTQVAEGYEPSDARVVAGVPVQWEIDSQALTCAASLYSPDLGIDYMGLEPGLNSLAFTLDEPGVYVYSCAMGMYVGTITAVAAPEP